ncbi:LOW QUALITY PROTEIN: bromodomain-containing protein 4 [Gymnodraco acuticeps]|uniref:LOW QUALITY PROTEIN: bromodomain-containing protein 4 n=1 Tax=Gymnodraco acuticeps TaxID=8218 RepID=A0A6P8VVL5_GYMAC|nr:LOW QUALITY PROTEIN: bromodomain-containing protein 4 [Gymnodraco acuticeps]
MASMQDGLNFTAPPYGKVLLLGAIAAASAFVVTILIVVLCVGCQRKGKTHNVPGEGGKHRLMDMGILRQSKLRSISKSDAEMNKMNCNGKSRQLPQIPEDGEHTYSEVATRTDDALYAMVGRAGQTDTPAPPAVPANTPAPPDPDGDAEGGMPDSEVMQPAPPPPETAEYACVRKLRKADKAPQKRDSGTDMAEAPVPQQRHPPPSHPAPPPPHPTHPHSTKLPRRNQDAFNVPAFPKEVMFMGNGEQYIWKPPEEEEMLMHQNKALGPLGAHTVENIQPSAAVVAEMYSKVCKPGKKKRAMPGSPPGNPGFRTLGRGDRDRDRDGGFSVVVKPQTWALPEGRAGALDDHCYESIGTEECDLAYENLDAAWKRERPPNTCATLRPRRKKSQQPLQQQQPPPPPPTQQQPPPHLQQAKALLLPGENLYESIGDLKQGSNTSSTTTIFTFNDGMEMYVTGL